MLNNFFSRQISIGNNAFRFSYAALSVFAIGLLVRLYVGFNSAIINLDGMVYINQAAALYHGQLDKIFSCTLNYLPLNSMLMVPAYILFNDWIIAGRFISFFFGFSLLIPVYLTLKDFFEEKICVVALLMIALTPTLVTRSADLLKDPVAWFFLSLAIYVFVNNTKIKSLLHIFLCSIFFILSAWSRNEFMLFYLATPIYILLYFKEKKITNLCIFLLPLLLLAGSAFVSAYLFDFHSYTLHRYTKSSLSVFNLFTHYGSLKNQLTTFAINAPWPIHYFLPEAANQSPLIALGAIITRWLEATLYLYGAIIVIGYFSIRQAGSKDNRIYYLFMLAVLGTVLLYNEMLRTWVVEYRYFGMVIIPSAVFAGYGLQALCSYTNKRTSLQQNIILFTIAIFILLLGLGKNIKPRYTDKAVFKEIGEYIAADAEIQATNSIQLAGVVNKNALEWVTFYSNYLRGDISCGRDIKLLSQNDLIDSKKLQRLLKEKQISYFLVGEYITFFGNKKKLHHSFKDFSSKNLAYLTLIKEWQQKGNGRLLLFKTDL